MLVEAERIKKKVEYDIRMIRETGFVNGIENYSLYGGGLKAQREGEGTAVRGGRGRSEGRVRPHHAPEVAGRECQAPGRRLDDAALPRAEDDACVAQGAGAARTRHRRSAAEAPRSARRT